METNIREYVEEYPVIVVKEQGRICLEAWNEGHNNCVRIDIVDVINWIKTNMPELI